MKIAKVITTSFVPRVVRENSVICGDPPGYFVHSQNFSTSESVIQLLQLNVELEARCDPGADVDLIIVNNDSGFKAGAQYLDRLDGMPVNRGQIRVLHKDNIGRSFGGYHFAFIHLREQYEYFIFTEDDIVLWRDGYARLGLDVFRSNQNCGFVAYQGISRKYKNHSMSDSIHAHGGVGLSSTKVLDAVVARYGLLPHATSNSSQSYQNIIENGEVAFTNKIHKLGFNLCELDPRRKVYDFAYDLMRDISVPRYASGAKLLNHNVEMFLKENFYRRIFMKN